MIARLTDTGISQDSRLRAAPMTRISGRTSSTFLSGLGGLAGMIRKAREQLRVSRDEYSLLDVVIPPGEDGPMSRQELNDWICRTSKENRKSRKDKQRP